MDIRGLITPSPKWPAAVQRRGLEEAGVKIIYEEKKAASLAGFPQRAAVIKALRRGSRLAVFGLRALGFGPADLLATLRKVFKARAEVWDVLTDTVIADCHIKALSAYAKARADWTIEATWRGRMEARRKKKLTGRPRKLHKPALAAAQEIWFNRRVKSNAEAAEKIGMSLRWCEMKFGPSGRPKGYGRKAK